MKRVVCQNIGAIAMENGAAQPLFLIRPAGPGQAAAGALPGVTGGMPTTGLADAGVQSFGGRGGCCS